MRHEEIFLSSTSQQFEFEKYSREIDSCNDMDALKEMCKYAVKLEMRTRQNCNVMVEDLLTQNLSFNQ